MLLNDLFDPVWHCGREKQGLNLLLVDPFDFFKDVVDILFESKFQHHISFVKNHRLKIGKVNISSVNMILYSSGGAHENVNSSFEVSRLVIDADTSVHRDNLKLVVIVLQLCQLVSDLNCKLSGWSENNRLHSISPEKIVFSEILNCGETESDGLARPSEVSCDQVLSSVHWVKAVLLDGEQVEEPILSEDFH